MPLAKILHLGTLGNNVASDVDDMIRLKRPPQELGLKTAGASIEVSSGRYLRNGMNMSASSRALSTTRLQSVNRRYGPFLVMIGFNTVYALSGNLSESCCCAPGTIPSLTIRVMQREGDSTSDGQFVTTAMRTCPISE